MLDGNARSGLFLAKQIDHALMKKLRQLRSMIQVLWLARDFYLMDYVELIMWYK